MILYTVPPDHNVLVSVLSVFQVYGPYFWPLVAVRKLELGPRLLPAPAGCLRPPPLCPGPPPNPWA